MRHLFQKDEIAIDLTSLLDVIFIVLLIVMCSQQLQAKDAREEAALAEQKTQEAQQIAQAYEDHIQKYEATEEYVLFLDVTAAYSQTYISRRTIRVMAGAEADGGAPFVIEIAPENAAAGFQELETYLNTKIGEYTSAKEGAGRPIILTLNKNDEDILYRDEEAINRIFQNLVQKYPDIYLR